MDQNKKIIQWSFQYNLLRMALAKANDDMIQALNEQMPQAKETPSRLYNEILSFMHSVNNAVHDAMDNHLKDI